MDSQVAVALVLSLVGGMSTSIGALFVVMNPAPNLKALGLLQGFAAGLMLSISFLDLTHNALNNIGFLKGNLWFFAGVIFFALVVNFIPEPNIFPYSESNAKKKEDDESGKSQMKKHRRQVLYSGIVTAIGMSLHNFPEGMAVFLGSIKIQTKRRSNLDPERLSKFVFIKNNKALYERFQKRRLQNKSEDYDPIVLDDMNYSSKCMTGRTGACNEFVYEEDGLTWTEGLRVGLNLAFAIALHNIPEGVAVALPIYFATESKWKAFKLATLSGFAEPLGVLIVAYLFPKSLSPELLEGLLGAVGGVMAFLTLHEMLPLAFDYAGQKQAIKAVFLGMAFMSASLYFLDMSLPEEISL